jgi:hypothetical protein
VRCLPDGGRRPYTIMVAYSMRKDLVSLPPKYSSNSASQVWDPDVLELVPDEVCVVWSSFLKEPLEVVFRRPRLMLVAACSGRSASHAGAARLPIVAIIMVGCGRGPLDALLAPLFATLDALLGTVGGDVGWLLLVAARGRLPTSLCRVKHAHLVARNPMVMHTV